MSDLYLTAGFLVCLMTIAFFYSSVGHGGATAYLALMALFGFNTIIMKTTALSLNMVVAGIAFISFYRSGFFRWRSLWPFLLTSVPASFVGGRTGIDPNVYRIILGILLLIAIARIIFLNKRPDKVIKAVPILPALLTGAALGFVCGFIGIGGGIILTPILLIFGWADIKEAAASSALFIWLNSASGFLAIAIDGITFPPELPLWASAVFITGLLGSWSGSRKWSYSGLSYILGGVLFIASVKLLFF
jgi:uncharacterized protein